MKRSACRVLATAASTALHRRRFTGAAAAGFAHTFQLVDATLEDRSGQPLEGWTASSASEFDDAHVAPGPEPAAAVPIGFGVLCPTGASRVRHRSQARFR